VFKSRHQAALLLAHSLLSYQGKGDTIVLAIPRGGVVIGKVISQKLKLPLDVVIIRKLRAPFNQELAIGAVGPKESKILDNKLIESLSVGDKYLKKEIKKQQQLIIEREKKYKKKTNLDLKGKNIILVDDGIATGATIEVAIKYLKSNKVKKIILAVPVSSPDSLKELEKITDEMVVLKSPTNFYAVGQFYEDFPQVDDQEVVRLLI